MWKLKLFNHLLKTNIMLNLTNFQVLLIISVVIIAGLIVYIKLLSMRIGELKEEAARNLWNPIPLEYVNLQKVVVTYFFKNSYQKDPHFITGVGAVYNYKSDRKTVPFWVELVFKHDQEPTPDFHCLYEICKPIHGKPYLEKVRA